MVKNDNLPVVSTVSSMSESVTVSVYGDSNLTVCPIKVFESDSILLKSIKGVVGSPVEVSLNGYKMDHASITFNYSDSDFNDIAEEDNLTIYWVDFENEKLVPLPDDKVSIDKVNNKITGIVNHFSVYIAGPKNLLDLYCNKNVVFAIDESGSMEFYDKKDFRRGLVSRFISDMNSITTKASIVTFGDGASTRISFTSDKESLKQEMEKLPKPNSSYTNFCAGLSDILPWGQPGYNFPYIPDFDGREKPILNITSGPYVVNDPVGISADCSDATSMVVEIDEPDTDPSSATTNYYSLENTASVNFNYNLKYQGYYIISAVADYQSNAPRDIPKCNQTKNMFDGEVIING